MANLISMTELCKQTGVSRQTLQKEIAAGRLTVAERGPRNSLLFDPAVALKEIPVERRKYLSRHRKGRNKGGRPRKKAPAPDALIEGDFSNIPDVGNFGDKFDLDVILHGIDEMSPDGQLNRADLAVKLARARLGALAVKEKEGQLVAVEEVRKYLARLAAQALGALIPIPGRLAEQFSAMTNANKIHELIEDEINRAIQIFHDAMGYKSGWDVEGATKHEDKQT